MDTVTMTHDTETDEDLVDLATAGDRGALEVLLRRQQAWIFNLAFYMLHHRQDAEDSTQEILVRVATGLSSFQRASAFRTWAHRIAVNHVLDRKRSRPETVVTGFDCYAEYLDRAPDEDFAGSERDSPETALLIQEASISCTMGMLLCLDRQQRMVFLLGEMLETNDVMGAELLGTSRENFRQLLARARAKLSGFMRGRYFDPFLEQRLDGIVALTRYYEALRGKIGAERFEIRNPRVQGATGLAVLTFNFVSFARDEAQSRWNCTEAYRQGADGWRIIQSHWSFTRPG